MDVLLLWICFEISALKFFYIMFFYLSILFTEIARIDVTDSK